MQRDSYEAIHTSIAPFPAHGLTFANTKLSKRRNASHAEEYGKFYIEVFRVTRHDSAPLLSESTTLKVMPKYWMISARGFWCKLLKGSVSCDNCRDDGTDLGTRSVQGTAL